MVKTVESDTTAGVDFDQWRALYDTMTFAQHQAFNARVAQQYPEQRCWNYDAAGRFLLERKPETVAELGGWDGALADLMLQAIPSIRRWVNYDITPNVPQIPDTRAYRRIVLKDWPWHRAIKADVLIASHVFEHMRIGEVEQLVAAWDVDAIYADVPIGPGACNWHGYCGSHIIEVGADELLYRLDLLGYRAAMVTRNAGGLIAYLDRAGA